MKSVLVLGGTGMLGSMVTDELSRKADLCVTSTYRATGRYAPVPMDRVSWHAFDAAADELAAALTACGRYDWIINAIGITKPLIRDDNAQQIERAIRINALLPHAIAAWAQDTDARVVQIATDCVYSGSKGSYTETDSHDAWDVYGKTKSLGECHTANTAHLRCSIIGPEPKDNKFLIEWFRAQPAGGSVNGFVNHKWNGITTMHFARICRGIIEMEPALPHLQHIVPKGAISKAQMLHEFAVAYGRLDLTINDTDAASVIDRTLATNDPGSNARLWEAAGYHEPPTVAEMIGEVARYEYRFCPTQSPWARQHA